MNSYVATTYLYRCCRNSYLTPDYAILQDRDSIAVCRLRRHHVTIYDIHREGTVAPGINRGSGKPVNLLGYALAAEGGFAIGIEGQAAALPAIALYHIVIVCIMEEENEAHE